jgi:hypothetical protein
LLILQILKSCEQLLQDCRIHRIYKISMDLQE